MARPAYPPARQGNIIDILHGTPVADPYRWLEDPESPETTAWVEAQNALTRSVLDVPRRSRIVERLWTLFDYPRTAVPVRRGGRYFVAHNTGLQNQPVLHVGESRGGPFRPLIDPNTLSPDGTTALTAAVPNEAGTLLAYALSRHGSDRQEIRLRDVDSGEDLPDRILWAKFATIAWLPDGSGFYYTRFPEPGTVPAGDEHYFCSAWFHAPGRRQNEDRLVFDAPDQRETVFEVRVADGGRWVVITARKGASDRSEVYLVDRGGPDGRPRPLFQGFGSAYDFIEAAGGRLLFTTDEDAPRGRVIAVDPAGESPIVSPIVPESEDRISGAVVAGDRLALSYLRNASHRLRIFGLAGGQTGEVPLPGLGTLTGLEGRPGDPELLLGFTSFTHPPATYACDVDGGDLIPLPPPVPAERAAPVWTDYETRQIWARSADGTRVPMFLVHRRGLPADGRRPVLLTGYGGFNIPLTPAYDPANLVLLEEGGLVAVANLRGGGEFGETWHEAGMLDRKQNVFDDFIAAAGWLVASGYTSPRHLVIEGGSNGGLLTAAAMLQRPDLFGAVVCRVPVVDMLRYHLFTVGRFWIAEYGCADDPDQFAWLLRYSPYHNVRDDVTYPPILITTADTDDRVSPGMAKKFAARLQAAAGNQSPVLIRIETGAGHGAGKPVARMVEEDADIFTFIFECGVRS